MSIVTCYDHRPVSGLYYSLGRSSGRTTSSRRTLVLNKLTLIQGCHWSGKSQGNSRSGKSQGILYWSGKFGILRKVREFWNWSGKFDFLVSYAQ